MISKKEIVHESAIMIKEMEAQTKEEAEKKSSRDYFVCNSKVRRGSRCRDNSNSGKSTK